MRAYAALGVRFDDVASANIALGVELWASSGLAMGHRSSIGQRCYIDARAGVRIDDDVSVSRGVAVLTATHVVDDPDFGATLDVVHHTDFLLGLLAEHKLVPKNPANGRVVYHDSCYLGRYNGVYESPREILKSIPGVELVEPEYWSKQRGLCCGAGGAQMFMEEQNQNRVNIKRTLQLVDTGATTVASACPFCMTMLHDGLKSQNLEEKIQQLDVAEILERACADVDTGTLSAAAE